MVQPLAVTLSATFGILATAGINGKWDLELWYATYAPSMKRKIF